MRDLEIRGAGSVMGEFQHGHMEHVGYDMYCKLLDQVVKELNGEEIVEESSEEDLGAYTVIKDANGNTVDLGGIEVIIRDWWSPAEAAEPKNAFEEARQEYRDWIQETYNACFKWF